MRVFIIKLIGYFVYKLSCLFPRNNKKWLLGDVMGFSGNTKYFLPELIEKNEDYGYQLYWITHDRSLIPAISKFGIQAYYWLNPIAIYHCLTAGVYIVTDCTKDINPYLSGKAYYVTLWHGIGLKGVGRLSKIYQSVPIEKRNDFYHKVLFFYWIYRTPDLCLTTSTFQLENFFMPMFGLPKEKFLLGMYPRNKILLKSHSEVKEFVKKYFSKEELDFLQYVETFNKTYIYMPTWRDDGRDFIAEAKINLQKLNDILHKNNELFIFKLHSKSKLKANAINDFSNIILLNNKFDVYPILPYTSTLITDYSSIYSDYILMNKEIIIFDFDKEEYMAKDRDLLFDFDKYTPAVRAHDFTTLLKLIEEHTDCHVIERDKVLDLFWGARNHPIDLFKEIQRRVFSNSIK